MQPGKRTGASDWEAEPECGTMADAGSLQVAGLSLVADCDGALFWPKEGVLAVADLHLEKGSSYAARGVLLPPYDTAETLLRLARIIARYVPRTVVALGDNFHDDDGQARISDSDREVLMTLQRGRDWVWIAGNHDPEPVRGLGGISLAALAIGGLMFRHRPDRDTADGEIAGHLHPVAQVSGRGRTFRRRCFACDGRRVVMPAFGAYAGGLNVRDRAFTELFGTRAFTAHILGARRLYSVSAMRCLGA